MSHEHSYTKLTAMAVLSFAAMYALMYAMVNSWDNVFPNYNQFYMAGLMAAPMVVFELWLMRAMYPDRKKNAAFLVAAIVLFIGFWFGIRGQAAIGDEQFLKSMIPHHAGAILMCNEAELEDEEIKELCRNIVEGQQAEIDFMKSKLESLE